jgi:hypothetical protein
MKERKVGRCLEVRDVKCARALLSHASLTWSHTITHTKNSALEPLGLGLCKPRHAIKKKESKKTTPLKAVASSCILPADICNVTHAHACACTHSARNAGATKAARYAIAGNRLIRDPRSELRAVSTLMHQRD